MKIIKSLKDFEKQIQEDIQKAVADTLKNEVFELVRDVVISHVHTDVYDVYEPSIYRRRRGNQGLSDEENIVYEMEDGTLVVWNIAKYNPYSENGPIFSSFSTEKRKDNILQRLVIDGYKNYIGNAPYALPRPFIENAGRDISKNGKHYRDLAEAFDDGLKRHKIYRKK